jgi:hypothetical protein
MKIQTTILTNSTDYKTFYIHGIILEKDLDLKFFAVQEKIYLPMADLGILDNAASGFNIIMTVVDKSGNYKLIVTRFLSRNEDDLRFCCGENNVFAMDAAHIKGWFPAESATEFCKNKSIDKGGIISALAETARFLAKKENMELKDNWAVMLTPEEDSFSVRLKEE